MSKALKLKELRLQAKPRSVAKMMRNCYATSHDVKPTPLPYFRLIPHGYLTDGRALLRIPDRHKADVDARLEKLLVRNRLGKPLDLNGGKPNIYDGSIVPDREQQRFDIVAYGELQAEFDNVYGSDMLVKLTDSSDRSWWYDAEYVRLAKKWHPNAVLSQGMAHSAKILWGHDGDEHVFTLMATSRG